MPALLFYVALVVGVLLCWAGVFWTVQNYRERREAERELEEFKEHLEKLQAAIGGPVLPGFAKMATAFAAAAGVAAREASQNLRAAAQAGGKLGRKEDR